jgi:hypothetical protein
MTREKPPGWDPCLDCNLAAAGVRDFCPYCWFRELHKRQVKTEDLFVEWVEDDVR